MRLCSSCKSPDKPWFEDAPCNCGRLIPHAEPIAASEHAPDCRCLGHEVIKFPVRMAVADLTFDKKLSSYYTQRGWALEQNGLRFYRKKMLCRKCIELENQAQERKAEYERACKAAQGLDQSTYAQMLAAQTMF